jgi:hypothetical protein
MHQYHLIRLLYDFISGEEAHSTRKRRAAPVPILVLMKIATKASMAMCFGSEVYGPPTRRNARVGATQRNVL